jgi:hypothetical protein
MMCGKACCFVGVISSRPARPRRSLFRGRDLRAGAAEDGGIGRLRGVSLFQSKQPVNGTEKSREEQD